MLRFIENANAAQAKGYYTEGLSREDYYTQGQEIAGVWRGRGAERLGLSGTVGKEAFDALCENRHPGSGGSLTPRTKSNRRVGYDINFHCPKSVSAIYALTGDRAILRSFQEAVRETMRELEAGTQTRVRAGGKFENRTTGNLVWGEFVHLTARPVNGLPDPHLHAHCFAFNATWDETEFRWKAGEFGELKATAPYFEAVFHARLARALRERGYGIDRGPKGWEVTGVPVTVIDKFSRRTAQIERLAEKKGIVSARDKDKLGAATRENKRKGMTLDDLRSLWDKSLTEIERAALGGVAAMRGTLRRSPPDQAEQAVSYALSHAFERRSAVPKTRLLELALRRGVGMCSVDRVKQELDRRLASGEVLSRAVEGHEHCTTREVLQEERELLAFARDGRGACRALAKPDYQFHSEKLSVEQANAVRHVLHSQDRVMLLRGRAGVGKTTLMREAVAAVEANGRKVFAFAPSAEASRGILRAEGFAGADTVASLLLREELQTGIRGQVIWIDEAGLLGTRTMKQVFDLAARKNARVILSGDTRQHTSVERGDALRLLERNAGLVSPEVKTIQRQRGEYREAISLLSDGRTAEGFEKLEALGSIREAEGEQRCRQIVNDYLKAAEVRRSVLVVSPTHGEGDRITSLLRSGLRERGALAPTSEERMILVSESLGWTEAERADSRHYESGQVIQFQQNARGFRKGEKLEVEWREGEPLARRADGTMVPIPARLARHFQVYGRKPLAVAPGDPIRFTCNGETVDKQHRVHNGSVQTVRGFTAEGHLQLENGWVVDRDYGHLTYGYVATSYASQGKTVDRVLIAQGSESFAAASQEQFYVSASRGRESVTVYTDSKAELMRSVRRSSLRMTATELMQPSPERESSDQAIARRAFRVNQLLAQARAWASRKASNTIERGRNLLSRYGRPGAGDPKGKDARPAVIEKYGRTPPPANDPAKEAQRRGRERGI